ncbi:hypothetical protein ES288_D06G228900v1 [Gossypium darwinii]|uniref:Pescadillo homolog n=1 Tax=Gossypium darwinii TaxID=34276 RepID=A0A5D2CB77_GOSDA|nr:hypothetical protein ES288_D06G228900v1 [Gossypium darwinii]
MGKPKHYRPPGKKKEGNAARYVTRSQAIKILQVSLSDFRKLCIHKGVFPREPKKKVKGNHHTYYHLKDVMYILHDPLLEKFREIRAYQRKIKKAKAKTNDELAKLLLSRAPSYRLDMVIRDRIEMDFQPGGCIEPGEGYDKYCACCCTYIKYCTLLCEIVVF